MPVFINIYCGDIFWFINTYKYVAIYQYYALSSSLCTLGVSLSAESVGPEVVPLCAVWPEHGQLWRPRRNLRYIVVYYIIIYIHYIVIYYIVIYGEVIHTPRDTLLMIISVC